MTDEWISMLDVKVLKGASDDEDLEAAFNSDNETTISKLLTTRITPNSSFIDEPNYWTKFKEEFWELVCGKDDRYAFERKILKELLDNVGGALMEQAARERFTQLATALIAGAIAAQMGLLWGVLLGFVGCMLLIVLKVGKEAYCGRR